MFVPFASSPINGLGAVAFDAKLGNTKTSSKEKPTSTSQTTTTTHPHHPTVVSASFSAHSCLSHVTIITYHHGISISLSPIVVTIESEDRSIVDRVDRTPTVYGDQPELTGSGPSYGYLLRNPLTSRLSLVLTVETPRREVMVAVRGIYASNYSIDRKSSLLMMPKSIGRCPSCFFL
ncbi:hypothetical protein BDV37DRAFT_243498 [Aspergillus pseudonomiae]|uniref:Uncharacterized protein n=1 Tax=Aspergillus pseudonomiae TaxID=1506151 RepID=A0A5N7DJF3_9EURO|nr:uncharacterized protein BDV37DRAFT_243498 [Aspergillus pseudonomiae]KAE8406259.1 hypothetical protein BDV37DRAFT_243498 [Aspergillus pseudonomiae]